MRWTPERAKQWVGKQGALRGCNYLPRTAVNATEMWQRDTYDRNTMAQELGWAKEKFGLNSVRVFLPFVVWEEDAAGLKQRFGEFLGLCGAAGFSVMPILFDDCAFSGKQPYTGKQQEPVPEVHNSGWTPSPGFQRADDLNGWPVLEAYVKDMVSSFGTDGRIVMWDLYNEPANSGRGEASLPLVEAAFRWARACAPVQPLTSGVWIDFNGAMSRTIASLSDIITFHFYKQPEHLQWSEIQHLLEEEGRPAICTEWLNRLLGNTAELILPIFAERKIGWYIWGLVAGRTQTYLPWEELKFDAPAGVWQHDVMHEDGTVYEEEERRRFIGDRVLDIGYRI